MTCSTASPADRAFSLDSRSAGAGQVREAQLRVQVMSDPHSPADYRVNGPLSSLDAFHATFDAAPKEKLYSSPDVRVRIW
jgi:predicted metalloendopeptidase